MIRSTDKASERGIRHRVSAARALSFRSISRSSSLTWQQESHAMAEYLAFITRNPRACGSKLHITMNMLSIMIFNLLGRFRSDLASLSPGRPMVLCLVRRRQGSAFLRARRPASSSDSVWAEYKRRWAPGTWARPGHGTAALQRKRAVHPQIGGAPRSLLALLKLPHFGFGATSALCGPSPGVTPETTAGRRGVAPHWPYSKVVVREVKQTSAGSHDQRHTSFELRVVTVVRMICSAGTAS